MELVVIWIAFAILCYAVAEKKGRNKLIAFGLGILFGIFSLIYYLIAKGSDEYELKEAEKKIAKLKGGDTKIC